MDNRILKLIIMTLALSVLAACQAATQKIPVSTNPAGATVYADGQEVCATPCNVTLEKTQAHILTFKKAGYKQADVQISQKYDTAGVTRDATESGMRSSSWGTSAEGAIANALLTAGEKEEDGSAYVLSPSSVVVSLVPEGQSAPTSDIPTINKDQLAPEDQKALVKTTEPATLESAAKDNPEKVAEDILTNAAVAAPTIGTKKEWKNSHSSESFNKDGSYNQSTSSTKTSVGVSVNPVEAGLGVLHLIEDAEKKKAPSEEQPAQ